MPERVRRPAAGAGPADRKDWLYPLPRLARPITPTRLLAIQRYARARVHLLAGVVRIDGDGDPPVVAPMGHPPTRRCAARGACENSMPWSAGQQIGGSVRRQPADPAGQPFAAPDIAERAMPPMPLDREAETCHAIYQVGRTVDACSHRSGGGTDRSGTVSALGLDPTGDEPLELFGWSLPGLSNMSSLDNPRC
jgi:hypothetical protein